MTIQIPANLISVAALLVLCVLWHGAASGAEPADFAAIERQFREMPMAARRLTGPLFWLHGDENETKERLEFYLDIVAKGQNGSFCAESRPHSDWLGPRWYRDLDICLQKAKELDLKMWIFDDAWWPSQTMGKRVLPEYAAKRLVAEAIPFTGPGRFEKKGCAVDNLVAVIAGKKVGDAVDGDSLVDLMPRIDGGTLVWDAPEGAWDVMTFTYEAAPASRQNGQVTVDGASRDCTDWFIETVYRPHYDRFKDDFGKTIVGFFYDEPETQGDWGTELAPMIAERGLDPKKLLVAWKFQLAGEDQTAARYAYYDAFFEVWGRTLYGSMTQWCEERGVASIGHFMDHGGLYLDHGLGAGNMFQMQKYSSMGGMDLVCRQLYPGQRVPDIYHLPKLTSSISHVYNKADHLAMCEIFGAYGQDLTYPQMKWLADHHQVRGVNSMITHSFNPKAPNDTDCPPYFYNDGQEPRWPLYRVWADYTSRLSLLLTGGRHVCPVAFLFCGNSAHVGKAVTPEGLTTALQDALFDCDWLPYDVFEQDCQIGSHEITLYDERYRVLVVPPVEVIPYGALAKAKQFYDEGGVVLAYGFLPTRSATFGKSAGDIQTLAESIWGNAKPGLDVCNTNAQGGRSYFLPEDVTREQLRTVLIGDAGVRPTLDVVEGDTNNWLHVLHRNKGGRDIFFVCNQDHEGPTRRFRLRAASSGSLECWDAMTNTITTVPCERPEPGVAEFDLTLEPSESVLLVFNPEQRVLLVRLEATAEPVETAEVERKNGAGATPTETSLSLEDCPWVWFPEDNPREAATPGTRFFRSEVAIPGEKEPAEAAFLLSADNEFALYVNGKQAGRSEPGSEAWRTPKTIEFTQYLRAGANAFAIKATNAADNPNPAGLIGRYLVKFEDGQTVTGAVDAAWLCSDQEREGWAQAEFDASQWPNAKETAKFGEPPWGRLSGNQGILPADPFLGSAVLPDQLAGRRVFLEMEPVPEGAAVHINGVFAGGVLGQPFRLDVTDAAKPGANEIVIEPYAPKAVRLALYE